MKQTKTCILACLLALALLGFGAQSALAELEFERVEVGLTDPTDGGPSRAAGAHPDLTTTFSFKADTFVNGCCGPQAGPSEDVRELDFALPPGMVGNPTVVPQCSSADLAAPGEGYSLCSVETQIGVVEITTVNGGNFATFSVPLSNIVPGSGEPARFGFNFNNVLATIVAHVRPGDYGISSGSLRISEAEPLRDVRVKLWGIPADPAHDSERGVGAIPLPGDPGTPSSQPLLPFLTNPTSCTETPVAFNTTANSWQNPGRTIAATRTADPDGTPFLFDGCEQLPFRPQMEASTLSRATESPTGLNVDLTVPQNESPTGRASAHVRKVKLTLPQGMSVSPSAAAGQGACDLTQIGYEGRAGEQQLLSYGLARAGSFTVSYGGQSTAPIAARGSAGAVQTALESLPGLAGNVSVSGSPGNWIVTFTGAIAGTDVAELSGTVTESPIQKVQVTGTEGGFNLHLGAADTAGSFETSFAAGAESIEYKNASRPLTEGTPIEGPGIATGTRALFPFAPFTSLSKPTTAEQTDVILKTELLFNVSATDLREALRQIPAFGQGSVFAGSTAGDTRSYEVVFSSEPPGAEPPLLTQTNSLAGPGAGVTVTNIPSATSDLKVATIAQAGGPTFNGNAPACPDSSILGTVQVDTPLLRTPLDGQVILAKQNENPFDSLIAMYMVVHGPGFYLKLPGRVDLDPQTGQLTSTFDNTPQLPFEKLHLALRGGPRAALVTPQACGTYQAQVEFLSWATDNPVTQSIPMTFDQGCNNGGFDPKLNAGSASALGGVFTPFNLQITRSDGETNLSRIEATLPEGVLAKLKGVALCSDAAAATADCPASSQVGTTTVGAGPGTNPVYVPEAGKAPTAVYLGDSYKGAPLSLVVKVPAQAGPFDLGTVTVRNALHVDPTTAQVTAKSDPLPQILQGIPIAYRDVRVEINRPNFTINPTNCDPMKVTSVLTSASGQTATPSSPFQVAGCGELGFKPNLQISLKGKMNRTGNPALKAVLKMPKSNQANIAKTTVVLPKSEFIDNSHISNPCTRVQFNANDCPAGSVLGKATAYSPLLDKPLTGPIYFRSNGGERELPDLVADLNGQIHVTLVGFIDSVPIKGTENSMVRTRFQNVPDAPVSKFVLKLKGGKKGLIENSENLCSFTPKAKVQMTGQNGKTANSSLKLGTSCGRAGKQKRKG